MVIYNWIKIVIVVGLVIVACISISVVRSLTGKLVVLPEPYDLDLAKIDSYYVNLDRATERKKVVEKQFKDQGLSVARFSAIDGSKIDINDPQYADNLKHTKDWYKEDKRRLGHFACFLSHLEIMKKTEEGDSPYCLIFEDDVEFLVSDFKNKVYQNMKNIPSDWDIVLFGYSIDDENDMVKKGNENLKVKDGIANITYFTGTHGYIIRRKALPTLLKELPKHEWLV